MRKLYENFRIFHFQKRIVSAETIRGNTVSAINIYIERNQNIINDIAWVKMGPWLHNSSKNVQCQIWCVVCLLQCPQCTLHSDPDCKKMSETLDFVWIYIIGFHLFITGKVHIFWEGHTILRNLHGRFDRY